MCKPCPDCGKPCNRGWPRCAECRTLLKLKKQQAWKIYRAMGSPGDWYTFFASYANRQMPVLPQLVRQGLLGAPSAPVSSSTDPTSKRRSKRCRTKRGPRTPTPEASDPTVVPGSAPSSAHPQGEGEVPARSTDPRSPGST